MGKLVSTWRLIDELAPLVLACERIADALERRSQRKTWPQPPPVCTGSGLERTAHGTCRICGMLVERQSQGFTLYPEADRCAPHPYIVRVADPHELLDDAKETP